MIVSYLGYTYSFLDALSRCGKFISCNALPSSSSFAKERISSSSCKAYNTRRYIPIATVGAPFSIRETVRGEQVARSATCAILRLRRKRASLICSPTVCIFCSNFRGNLVPIVLFAIAVTYHIICKYNTFSLFYDRLSAKMTIVRKNFMACTPC